MIGRMAGRIDGSASMTSRNEALNLLEEQAQKSSALSLGRSHNNLRMTFASKSSSICSWARNSRRLGVRSKHLRRVDGIRFRVSCRSRIVTPAPRGLKWQKSSRRTIVPSDGYSVI